MRIYGEEYPISSSTDPEEVQRIGEYVDQKMRSIASQHSGRVAKATLAVLAAMEITSELFDVIREQSELTETAQENLQRLNRLVDERAGMYTSLLKHTQDYRRHLQDEPVHQPEAKRGS